MAATMRPATAAEMAAKYGEDGSCWEMAAAGVGTAPVLPGGLSANVAVFHNWAGDIHLDQTWRVDVTSGDQVAALATWA